MSNPTPSEFTALACIVAKYHPATNSRCSRVSARRGDHDPKKGDKVAWVNYGEYSNGGNIEPYAVAALKCLELNGLNWELSRHAGFADGGYIFVTEGFTRPA